MEEPLARAVELNPNLPDALNDYAHWHWFNVGPHGVAELYRRALDLDALNVSRYGALGMFLALNAQPQAAREVIEQMKALFNDPVAYRAIANLYDLVGDVDHSIAWTIKARDAEPLNRDHVGKLAEYFVDIGDFDTAEALTPDLSVGLLFKMRRFDDMINLAEELIFDYPDDVQLRVYLATAYSIKGRHELAIRLISTSGVLDTWANGRRDTEEFNALGALNNAVYGSGHIDEARDLIKQSRDMHYEGDTTDWWVALGLACVHAILSNDAEVYRRFQQALKGRHLPWDPLLKDVECFKRFADDPAYLAVIDHFDGLREMLRDRLPATLAQYGVTL